MGLSFTIAAGLASTVILRSESYGTRDQFLLSDLRLPQPGGPGPHIYITQEQGGPVIPTRHWVPFSSSSTTCRATVEVFDPISTQEYIVSLLKALLNNPQKRETE
jgi:hypothetical protein